MQNNAHLGETREHRTNRFQDGHPIETIDTLINSIHNYFNNEIKATTQVTPHQTSLMILGIHAVALTVAWGFWGEKGKAGYKHFLENFVDGDTPDTKFSMIADEIHQWRNVLAHRWLSVSGHTFGYDYTLAEGWAKNDGITLLNPKIYLEHYLKAFGHNGRIYKFQEILTTEDLLQEAKTRILSQYLEEN